MIAIFSIIQIYIEAFYNNDFKKVIAILSEVSQQPTTALIIMVYLRRKNEFWEIANILQELFPAWIEEQKKHQVDKYQQNLMRFVAFYVRLTQTLVLIYVFVELLKIVQQGTDKQLEYMWLPFYNANLFVFVVLSIWIAWIPFIVVIPQTANNIMIIIFTSVLSMEFDFLRNDMKELLKNRKSTMNDLKYLVDKHNRLLEVSTRLKKVFSFYMLYDFLHISLMICFSGAAALITEGENLITFASTLGFGLIHHYLPFHSGQKLFDSSVGVSDAILNSDWYNIDDIGVKKSLIIMIQAAHRGKFHQN